MFKVGAYFVTRSPLGVFCSHTDPYFSSFSPSPWQPRGAEQAVHHRKWQTLKLLGGWGWTDHSFPDMVLKHFVSSHQSIWDSFRIFIFWRLIPCTSDSALLNLQINSSHPNILRGLRGLPAGTRSTSRSASWPGTTARFCRHWRPPLPELPTPESLFAPYFSPPLEEESAFFISPVWWTLPMWFNQNYHIVHCILRIMLCEPAPFFCPHFLSLPSSFFFWKAGENTV